MGPYRITMQNTQTTPDGQSETLNLMTIGDLKTEMHPDGVPVHVLTYNDTEEVGYPDSVTSIHISPKQVIIMRTGSAATELTLDPGHKHYSLYETPYGNFTLGVDTRSLRVYDMNADGGSFQAKYALDIDGAFISETELRMHWQLEEAPAAPTEDEEDTHVEGQEA